MTKKLLLLILATLLFDASFSQPVNISGIIDNHRKVREKPEILGMEKLFRWRAFSGEGCYVLDSTYYYFANTYGQEWFNDEIYRVLSRDEYGNFTEAKSMGFDTLSGNWMSRYSFLATYHDSLTQELWLVKVWYPGSKKWLLSDSIAFDLDGKTLVNWYKTWDFQSNKFTKGYRTSYFYNENLLEKKIKQKLDTVNDNWKTYSKMQYEYDTSALLTEDVFRMWDTISMSWRDSTKNLYYYDENEYLIEQIVQIWDKTSEGWINSFRWEHSYNQNGNEKERIKQSWQKNTGNWVNSKRYVFYYDENLWLTERIIQLWEGYKAEWVNDNRNVYTYNTAGKRTEYLSQYWDSFGGIWQNVYRQLYDYDMSGNQTEYLFQSWDYSNGVWLNEYKNENYWSEFIPGGIFIYDRYSCNIYPNPSDGIFYIKFSGFEKPVNYSVFDLSGKHIISGIICHGQKCVALSELNSGVYFIRITYKNYSGTEKIVIK